MVVEPGERLRLELRRHGVVLARPLAGAGLVGVVGGAVAAAGWPLVVAGAALLATAAGVAARAVWRWERTRVLVTTHRLVVLDGTLRRRAAAVRLDRGRAVEVDEPVAGRLLGYGTIVAGDLEITHVPRPRDVSRLLA